MKHWSLLPGLTAMALLAACSGPDTSVDEADSSETVSVFNEDNLATYEACFADTPSDFLEPGQALIERGPSGVIRVSHNLGNAPADYEFTIIALSETQRRMVDDAAANFFRAAGEAHDYATDEVIYHRSRDGTFCAVARGTAIGQPLADAAARAQADIDANPPAQDN